MNPAAAIEPPHPSRIPPANEPVIDPRTGHMSEGWYNYFVRLDQYLVRLDLWLIHRPKARSYTLEIEDPQDPPLYGVLPNPSSSIDPSVDSEGAGSIIFVTNEVDGPVLAFSDGTNWLRITDGAVVTAPPPPP